MYERFYGMREPAFTLTPNPAFLYLNERSKEGLAQILYGIRRREGFALIGGDVGTGKTTLCWALLEKLDERNIRTALVQNSLLSATDILKSILHDLGVRPKGVLPDEGSPNAGLFDTSWMAGMGKLELIERLNSFLIEMAHQGVFTVLIVDEAQNLSMETMEQLRLLSNLEIASEKLLQIIFVGQLELQQMLERPALRQLNQRISVRFETKTLTAKETEEYICHRLRIAGAIPSLRFAKKAFKAIHKHSQGYPRLINMICDRALLCCFRERSYTLTARMVLEGFHALREPVSQRSSIWIRKVLPIFGVLSLVSLLIFLIALRLATPDKPLERPPVSSPAAATSAAPPSTEIGSSKAGPPAPMAVPPGKSPRAEPERLPAAAKGTPRQLSKTGYILQISSHRELKEAESASQRLKGSGYPSFVIYQPTGIRSEWYGVYIGPYEEITTARKVASTLKSTGMAAPILRRR